jgi:hypothetical protein
VAVVVRDPSWFAAVIRHAASLRGYPTQAALAEAGGLSLNSVVNVVTGARASYRQATVEHLATGLGVPSGRLVAYAATGGDGDPLAAAQALLDPVPADGVVSFVVTVEGLDASVVETALAAALASVSTTRPGAHAWFRPVD